LHFNEGLGKVLRYGAYSDEVIEKLKWMEKVLYPTLKKAVESIGKIDLKNLIAQALHMAMNYTIETGQVLRYFIEQSHQKSLKQPKARNSSQSVKLHQWK
jgi:hypothetical protein